MATTHTAEFPKTARLLKTDEFSSVFRLRPWARTEHFVLYGRAHDGNARLGMVVGKKYARRAVTRNLVRRIVREAFRQQRTPLYGWDILVRLHTRFDPQLFPAASCPALKALCQREIAVLFAKAGQRAASNTK